VSSTFHFNQYWCLQPFTSTSIGVFNLSFQPVLVSSTFHFNQYSCLQLFTSTSTGVFNLSFQPVLVSSTFHFNQYSCLQLFTSTSTGVFNLSLNPIECLQSWSEAHNIVRWNSRLALSVNTQAFRNTQSPNACYSFVVGNFKYSSSSFCIGMNGRCFVFLYHTASPVLNTVQAPL